MVDAQASGRTARRIFFPAILLAGLAGLVVFPSGCSTVYGIAALVFCRESTVHLTTKIEVRDGHFGMRMWPRSFGQLSLMMIRCDSATLRKITALHYDTSRISEPTLWADKRPDPDPDTSRGTLLGTLKMYRKKRMVRESALYPARYAANGQDYIGIGNTGLDEFRADSLEIINASPLLNGLQADFVEHHRCMCGLDHGSGAKDRFAAADPARATAF